MAEKRQPRKIHDTIQIDDKLISGELLDEMFHCDIASCKGACCVEGDLGAPLEDHELKILQEIYESVKPYLRKEGIKAIEDQGVAVLDFTHTYSTPLVKGKECAYVTFDEKGIASCGIEQAWADGQIDFRKPVSCHLYPVRIQEYDEFDALNYHRWNICSAACSLGEEKGVPIYQFVKDALIRKYGQEFYDKLEVVIKQMTEE